MPPEKLHWKHLYHEVVTAGTCTGCSGCIVACPYDVLGFDQHWHPFLLEGGNDPDAPRGAGPGPIAVQDVVGGPMSPAVFNYGTPATEADGCVHGEKGCTLCTRACPRFRAWEIEADTHLFGRVRTEDEVIGISRDVILARTTNAEWLEKGQDGGLCSAILIYALRKGMIDAALVSYVDEKWRAIPGVARTEEEILRAAGSRYTYTANTLAYADAVAGGAEKIALVGMSCQSSVPPVMNVRGAKKPAGRLVLNLGLLCSKTFTDDIFEGLIEPEYGLTRDRITKMNIKGKLQLWHDADGYTEVPLKACHAYTRPGCKTCPDFAAEHADISLGGLGQSAGWTLTVVRTQLGRDLLVEMLEAGWIEGRPGDDDPAAIALMRKLAANQRKRWPAANGDADYARPSIIPAEYAAGKPH